MSFQWLLSDSAVLAEIGKRLARRRLDLNLTQAALAEEAGVAKRTVERVEAGESTQLSTFVRLLQVLELVDGLDALLPDPGPSPIDLLKLKGKERQRASSPSRLREPSAKWTWGDDDDAKTGSAP